TDFPCPCVNRILPPLVADFIREAHTDGPVPFLRDGNARPDVITNPLPALTLGYGSENVKAALEPVGEAVGDLDGLMLGVIGGINTIDDRLRAVDRKVAVKLNHGVSGIDEVGPVHLDFVVVLSPCVGRSQDEGQICDREKAAAHKSAAENKAPNCHL